MTTQLVIVGNGMAAVRLVEQLLQHAPDRFAITLIGDEPGVAYNRILLSRFWAVRRPLPRLYCIRRRGIRRMASPC